MTSRTEKTVLYAGSYADEESEGIHVFELDLLTGALERTGGVEGIANPSYLVPHPDGRFLYATSEVARFEGERGGAVAGFALEDAGRSLSPLNRRGTGGPGPCHLTVDATGSFVLAANYGGGSVSVLPVGPDGRLGDRTELVQHRGSSAHPKRQRGPHTHSVTLDPSNAFALVADLGLDRVMIYRLERETGLLSLNADPWHQARRGAGPRHFAFAPGGWFAYLVNELDSTVTAFRWRPVRGGLEQVQTLSALPPGFSGQNIAADIHVHPTGRFVYASNRGHDSIAVFARNSETGRLRLLEHEPTGGRTPRGFTISPDGRWLLAANKDSGNVVVFRVDRQSGRLAPAAEVAGVQSPTCVTFAPPA